MSNQLIRKWKWYHLGMSKRITYHHLLINVCCHSLFSLANKEQWPSIKVTTTTIQFQGRGILFLSFSFLFRFCFLNYLFSVSSSRQPSFSPSDFYCLDAHIISMSSWLCLLPTLVQKAVQAVAGAWTYLQQAIGVCAFFECIRSLSHPNHILLFTSFASLHVIFNT
ncbi:hypothetical protein BDA99DRAFT_214222 [Phascolomyces articulosus]|uniref:Uncharacterized protein n=1 Tax=Phascolomyces articulosus TaxID=60185 RepID=A0AAD5K158_9FUNG|nr:hypothetical protein BDA99DRAFT_214222 [Phascolomyces articulosus]